MNTWIVAALIGGGVLAGVLGTCAGLTIYIRAGRRR